LLSANSSELIEKAIEAIFNQLKKIKHSQNYPLSRAMQLIEAL
jgi:hypothetical protein